ncbi:MAG: lipopolysaccharide kinase InaA family protein [Candidatus Binatia bacterium]
MTGIVLPPGFEWVRGERATFLVRSDVRSWMVPLLQAAGRDGMQEISRRFAGGRGGTSVVCRHGRAVVLRPCRRGGLPARLLRDTYFGWRPRPFRELCVTETLRRRGAPAVEVYGAAVWWHLPGCYRGWLATRYLSQTRTFWEWAVHAVPIEKREVVMRQVGRAIRRLHDSGGRHPDLNVHNILICPPPCSTQVAGTPAVVLIDFDRARMNQRGRPEADLERLHRSARKLDPQGARVTVADLRHVEAGYRESGP